MATEDEERDAEEWKRESNMLMVGGETAAKVEKAWQDERERCAALVAKQIATGLHAGLTENAPSIRILRRIFESIKDGHYT